MQYAISYRRFSTAKQARGDSRRRQSELAEQYCKRHKIKLLDTYLDAGRSGFSGEHLRDNGALRALLDKAKTDRFPPRTLLIVESLDRLSRLEMSTALRLFLDILDTGLVIVTLIDGEQIFTKERVDADPTALMFAIMILSRANNQSRTNKERALAAWRAARIRARQQKTPITAQCPAWLSVVGRRGSKHFMVDKDRAAVIEQIFQLAVSGMGHERIAKLLNKTDVLTFNGRPKWTIGMVANICRSRAVIGMYVPHLSILKNGVKIKIADTEGVIEEYYPPIISVALYREYKLSAARRMHHNSGNRGNPYSNLITRIARCESCGHTLEHDRHTHGYDYLRCPNSKLRECSNGRGYPYHSLEPMLLVFDDLTEIVARLLPERHSAKGSARRVSRLGASIASIKSKLERMPLLPGETTARQVGGLRAKLARLEDELAEAKPWTNRVNLTARNGPLARFREAKIRAQSTEIRARHLGRADLAAELRKLILGVVLHKNRLLTVHTNPELLGCRIAYALGPDGLTGIQVIVPEGGTGFIGVSIFRTVVSPKRPPRRGPRDATDEPLWRSLDVNELMERIHVVRSANGDWQAVMPEPTQIGHVALRGEQALTFRSSLVAKPAASPPEGYEF
jgi:DNA invertase Pin-like site-specific DNA recombinase